MRQFALIGLGKFSRDVLTQLSEATDEIVIVERDPVLVEKVKDLARNAFIIASYDEETLTGVLPENIDVAVVDIVDNLEATLMVTHTLKKMGVGEIVVKTDSDERSELLKIIGATRIVQADREAAARIVPLLFSSSLYNFIPLGSNLVMAEVAVPKKYCGMTLVQADLRKRHAINVIAIRSGNTDEYRYFDAEYPLHQDDILLLSGREKEVMAFSGLAEREVPKMSEQKKTGERFRRMMKGRK
ncbi:MAG: TrkA family potassium uptake protein [Rectinemataceae bacterium]|nr:TrkA family potassium uptake protein [Rectinemataceae bacterium]